jgi:hypothetical protein
MKDSNEGQLEVSQLRGRVFPKTAYLFHLCIDQEVMLDQCCERVQVARLQNDDSSTRREAS